MPLLPENARDMDYAALQPGGQALYCSGPLPCSGPAMLRDSDIAARRHIMQQAPPFLRTETAVRSMRCMLIGPARGYPLRSMPAPPAQPANPLPAAAGHWVLPKALPWTPQPFYQWIEDVSA